MLSKLLGQKDEMLGLVRPLIEANNHHPSCFSSKVMTKNVFFAKWQKT